MNASTSVSIKQSPGRGMKRKKGQQLPGDLEVGNIQVLKSIQSIV